MELTPKKKPKPAPVPAPPPWRVRAPVSKADRDAIHAFKRSIDSFNWIKKQLGDANAKVEASFEELKRRGQIEFLTKSEDTSAKVAEDVTHTTEGE